MRLPIASLPFLLSGALAQIPTDAVLVLETTNAFYVPNWRIVDPFGGGHTILHNQNVWSLPSPVAVAVDPVNPRFFFFQTNPSSLAGTWRQDVDRLAIAQQAMWGPWQQGSAERIACGPNHVFTLQGGTVTRSARTAGGGITPMFTVANAVDIAAAGTFVFVATNGAGAASPLLEHDLATNTQRVVGTYTGVRAIAASPNLPELAVGLDNGQVLRLDLATGAILATLPGAGLPIVAVDFTTFGTLVWADAAHVYSELVPTPIYTAVQAIADLSVGRAPTASVTPFGGGCGVNGAAQWLTTGLPTLGNAAFQVGFGAYPSAPLVLLALGTSRIASGTLGVGLPFDLTPVGAPGCDLLVDPEVVLALTTFGSVQLPIPIPNNPALAGQPFHVQGFVRQTTNALGLEATPGLACVIR